jgi:hypothetical protein
MLPQDSHAESRIPSNSKRLVDARIDWYWSWPRDPQLHSSETSAPFIGRAAGMRLKEQKLLRTGCRLTEMDMRVY